VRVSCVTFRSSECYAVRVTSVSDVRVLTVAEVAGALRVSPMTVYRLIKTGELQSTRIGKLFRIYEGSFQRYIASHSGADGVS
jgi:excisionase family DNA binding protein